MNDQDKTKTSIETNCIKRDDIVFTSAEKFDHWLTRQLNCLVGRHITFATPASVKDFDAGINNRSR